MYVDSFRHRRIKIRWTIGTIVASGLWIALLYVLVRYGQ